MIYDNMYLVSFEYCDYIYAEDIDTFTEVVGNCVVSIVDAKRIAPWCEKRIKDHSHIKKYLKEFKSKDWELDQKFDDENSATFRWEKVLKDETAFLLTFTPIEMLY